MHYTGLHLKVLVYNISLKPTHVSTNVVVNADKKIICTSICRLFGRKYSWKILINRGALRLAPNFVDLKVARIEMLDLFTLYRVRH